MCCLEGNKMSPRCLKLICIYYTMHFFFKSIKINDIYMYIIMEIDIYVHYMCIMHFCSIILFRRMYTYMYILHPWSPLVTPDFFTRNHSILSGFKILHFCEDLWNGKRVCFESICNCQTNVYYVFQQ